MCYNGIVKHFGENMKNLGFTLSEVLITLGIIGIVAALTVPGVINSSNSSTNMASLARTYEQMQIAMADLINRAQQNDQSITTLDLIKVKNVITDADSIGLNAETYVTAVDRSVDNVNLLSLTRLYSGIQSYTPKNADYLTSIKNYNGEDLSETFFDNTEIFKFPKKIALLIYRNIDESEMESASNGGTLNKSTVLTKIFIDVNGEKEPNRIGHDIFLYGLSNDGKMIPAGTDDYNKNVFNEQITNFSTACSSTSDEAFNALSCAARIMADNWKQNYK